MDLKKRREDKFADWLVYGQDYLFQPSWAQNEMRELTRKQIAKKSLL